MTDNNKIESALDMIIRHGGHDGDHHKAWCLDQVTRILAGNTRYKKIVKECIDEGYDWDIGIPP